MENKTVDHADIIFKLLDILFPKLTIVTLSKYSMFDTYFKDENGWVIGSSNGHFSMRTDSFMLVQRYLPLKPDILKDSINTWVNVRYGNLIK